MLRVGITGGIASGKSTVAELIRQHGFEVLDLDKLGHRMIQPGLPAFNEIVSIFGPAILASDGQIDRHRLGTIVFADPAQLATLNSILHPRIREEAEKWFTAQDRSGAQPFAFVEAALLLEAGYRKWLDRLVVCWSPPEQQRERMIARGLTPEQADRRLAAQMDVGEKRRAADDVIDCSGSLAETERQVEQLLHALKRATSFGNFS